MFEANIVGDTLRKVQAGDPLAIPAGTFNTFVDAAAKAIVKVPVAAYVEKVYEEADFAALGIGT